MLMTNKYNFLSYIYIQVAEEIKSKIYYIIFNILHLLRGVFDEGYFHIIWLGLILSSFSVNTATCLTSKQPPHKVLEA